MFISAGPLKRGSHGIMMVSPKKGSKGFKTTESHFIDRITWYGSKPLANRAALHITRIFFGDV
jgi:hypothetical protein